MRIHTKNWRKRTVIISANGFAILLTLMIFLTGLLLPLDRSLYGFYMKQTMTHQPDEHIIVIGIDQTSLEQIGRFPWDRSIYVPLLEKLNQPGNEAAVIAFDITFSSESDPESDNALNAALRKYDNVILPVIANLESEFSRSTIVQKDDFIKASNLEIPYSPFAETAELAHINASLDSDGMIRRTWLVFDTPEGELPSLAYKTAEMFGADIEHYLTLQPQSELLIDYQATSYDFMTVPFAAVLSGDFPSSNFKDAIVLIGFTAVGFESDNGATPVEQEMKLVYVHANIIQQLLQGTMIQMMPDWAVLLIIILAVALSIFLSWKFKASLSLPLLMGSIAALFIVQYLFFQEHRLYIDTVNPAVSMAFVYLVNTSIKSFYESKQKHFITKQFGRYLSPDLVKEIAESETEIALGGVKKEISVLFLDIRGFTPLSEKMQPEEVVDFLNMMFNLITEKTVENKGTIDKFIGDAAMLIFNAPLEVSDHAYYAVKTACAIQEGMHDVTKQIYQKYGVEVNVGIGINTGEAVVGNIGSYIRVDYTAIGDNVNIAARIESQTEAGQILVSEAVYERTKEQFEFENAGEFHLKGKSIGIHLYEVKGMRG